MRGVGKGGGCGGGGRRRGVARFPNGLPELMQGSTKFPNSLPDRCAFFVALLALLLVVFVALRLSLLLLLLGVPAGPFSCLIDGGRGLSCPRGKSEEGQEMQNQKRESDTGHCASRPPQVRPGGLRTVEGEVRGRKDKICKRNTRCEVAKVTVQVGLRDRGGADGGYGEARGRVGKRSPWWCLSGCGGVFCWWWYNGGGGGGVGGSGGGSMVVVTMLLSGGGPRINCNVAAGAIKDPSASILLGEVISGSAGYYHQG